MIFFDNAATTIKKPKCVVDAVTEALCSMGNAGRGANEASLSASRIIFDTRDRLCKLFNGTNPKQIVFTNNSTESLNIAIKGLLNPVNVGIEKIATENNGAVTEVVENIVWTNPSANVENVAGFVGFAGSEMTFSNCVNLTKMQIRQN